MAGAEAPLLIGAHSQGRAPTACLPWSFCSFGGKVVGRGVKRSLIRRLLSPNCAHQLTQTGSRQMWWLLLVANSSLAYVLPLRIWHAPVPDGLICLQLLWDVKLYALEAELDLQVRASFLVSVVIAHRPLLQLAKCLGVAGELYCLQLHVHFGQCLE